VGAFIVFAGLLALLSNTVGYNKGFVDGEQKNISQTRHLRPLAECYCSRGLLKGTVEYVECVRNFENVNLGEMYRKEK
jgi:hypothetical protein